MSDPNTPRPEPPVPPRAGGRRYHEALGDGVWQEHQWGPLCTHFTIQDHPRVPGPIGRPDIPLDPEQDSPDYQDAALARLQSKYRTADVIASATVLAGLLLIAAALYRWFILP